MYDSRVIAQQSPTSGLQVLAHRQEVMWRDGTAAVLHPVQAHDGRPMTTLRAVALPGQVLQLVDLERMQPQLGLKLRQAPVRDQAGLVFFTLRHAFGSAPAFLAAVVRLAKGRWQPGGTGLVWVAAARAVDAEVLATADLDARSGGPLPMLGAA